MIDLFSIIKNFIAPTLAAMLLLLVAAFSLYISGKWQQYFFTVGGYVRTVVFVMIAVACFLEMPNSTHQILIRSIIAIALTLFLVLKVYGKEHILFPKNLIIRNWEKVYKNKGKLLYKLAYNCLSTYEKMVVDIEEIRYICQKEPYEAYCRLKKMDVSQFGFGVQEKYSQTLGASLLAMGALKEAKAVAEKLYEDNPHNLKTLAMLCTILDITGKEDKAKKIAEDAYQSLFTGNLKADIDLQAEVYHNYAVFLLKEGHIDKGLDIAKESADFILQQNNLRCTHFVLGDYLKLLAQYRRYDRLKEYLKKYEDAIPGDCDASIPYINTKLYLMSMGYSIEDTQYYLRHIYNLNKDQLDAQGRCFMCQSCMNVAFSHDIDIDEYLKEIVSLMKNECEQLETIKRIRFYDRLGKVAGEYDIHCKKNGFEKSIHFNEFLMLYLDYTNTRKENEVKKILDTTESICVAQKCELREMMLRIQYRKQYDFDKIYEGLVQLYRELELGCNLRAMLEIDIQVIHECTSTANIIVPTADPRDVRSTKVDVLNKHLQDAEKLLMIINYEDAWAEFAIPMSLGHVFAGNFTEAKKYLNIFENSQMPDSFLLAWDRHNLQILRNIL